MKKYAGFTLIELMIAVVIIGILAAIVYPSYRDYMTQSRRSDAQILLLQAAARQEKFYSDCSTYAANLGGDPDCQTGTLGLGTASPNADYQLMAPIPGNINGPNCQSGQEDADIACGFTLVANPIAGGRQAGDGALRIDAMGVRQWNRNGTWVRWDSR